MLGQLLLLGIGILLTTGFGLAVWAIVRGEHRIDDIFDRIEQNNKRLP